MPESLKNKTVKGVFWSAVDRFSVAGISFIFGLILARLLSPSDYGVIAMLTIFMAISQAFIDSGFSGALIRKPDRTETDNATAFYFNIVVGATCYLIMFFIAPIIADFYDTPLLVPVTRVMAINLFINSLCVVQQALLSVRLDFKTQAKISLTATIISGLTGITLAYLGYGVWALVMQTVIVAFLRMLLLWILAKWRPVERFSKKSFKELFSYGSKMLASGLLETTYNNLYTIVIGKKFTAVSLGYYARADQFAQFPSVSITGILQRVTLPVLSTIQNEDERLRTNYRKFLRMSAFVTFPLMMLLVAFAEPFIRFVLTDKWAAAIPLLQILCFATMWYPIHAINLSLLQVKGRSDLFFRLEVIKKIIGVITLCITIPLGITAMCYGRVVTSIIALVINTHYTGKLIQVGYWRQMKDILPVMLNSVVMLGVCLLIQIPIDNSYLLSMIATVAIAFIYYLSSSYFLHSGELKEIMSLVRREKK